MVAVMKCKARAFWPYHK